MVGEGGTWPKAVAHPVSGPPAKKHEKNALMEKMSKLKIWQINFHNDGRRQQIISTCPNLQFCSFSPSMRSFSRFFAGGPETGWATAFGQAPPPPTTMFRLPSNFKTRAQPRAQLHPQP